MSAKHQVSTHQSDNWCRVCGDEIVPGPTRYCPGVDCIEAAIASAKRRRERGANVRRELSVLYTARSERRANTTDNP